MMRSLILTVTTILAGCIFLAGQAQAHPAWGLAVDSQGQIYFSDLETIWKIDTQGRLSIFRAGVSGRHTHDLNIDEAGNLYGADNSYEPATQRFFSAIWKMTPARDFSYLLAPSDNPPTGTSIWKDRDGNMYHVTNYPARELLVLKRSPSGQITVLDGSGNAARSYRQGVPYSVGGMAFSREGELYFTHGASVSKVSSRGAVTALARNLVLEGASDNKTAKGAPTQLFGIALDAQGNAFVADYGNRRVLKITPGGQTTTLLRAEESWSPTGVAVRDKEFYILEIGQASASAPIVTRVRKLAPDGSVTVLATVGGNSNPTGAGASPSVNEGSSGKSSERTVESRPGMLYVALGAGAGIFALTIIVWRRRRRISDRQD
jgi:hypothetical protein